MLTAICAELKNYFCMKDDRIIGDFSIVDGMIVPSIDIAKNQYFRIVGSVFNDGVHQFTEELSLIDESSFHGAIWLMRVPQEVIQLASDISEWQTKYGAVDNPTMSPYQSESFGGYSYSKGNRGVGTQSTAAVSWLDVFEPRLRPYRRIRVI